MQQEPLWRRLTQLERLNLKYAKAAARKARFIKQHQQLDITASRTWGDQLLYVIRGYNIHFFAAYDGLSEPMIEPHYVASAYRPIK